MNALTKKISVALLSSLTLAGCVSEKRGGDAGTDSLALGAPMPGFAVSGPEGTLTTADMVGRPAVVALFRTTCPDCSREMPGVEAAFRRLKGSGVRFVAISKEEDHAVKVPQYWADTGMTMPYFFDPDGAAFAAFDVHFVPTLYLFGSDGKVAYAAVETFNFSPDELVKLIEELK